MNQERVAANLVGTLLDVWCERNDTAVIMFNCNRCEFRQEDKCLAKMFINKHRETDAYFPQGMIKESED